MKRLFVLLLLLSACHRAPAKVSAPIYRTGYGFVRLENGVTAIIGTTEEHKREALREIECKPCVIDEWKLWIVHQPAK